MRRSGRILSISLSALAILALGFMVSIAADSVPGRGPEEPLLDVGWRPGIDMTTVLTWLLVVAAVMGAVILALSFKEPRPPREGKRSGIIGLVLGVVVFALIARYMRSIADTLLPETSEVIGEVGEEPIADSGGITAWVWSLLVAAVIAVALTRVGLAIRSGAPPEGIYQSDHEDLPSDVVSVPSQSTPDRGSDPRNRILSAYGDFEQDVAEAGLPREPAETAARHAGRAKAALDLTGEDLIALSARHADARFGPDEPSSDAASAAESAATRLRREMGR